jgi:RNA polymerase-interacting CarD/CdnL/TRCF family regulator
VSKSQDNEKNHEFKVGDHLVKFGKLYKITKIKEEEVADSKKTERILYYRPVYIQRERHNVLCSIPEKNVNKIDIRRPHDKKKLTTFLENLTEITQSENKLKTKKVKTYVYTNNLNDVAYYMKNLWLEKKDPDINYVTSKRRVFEKLLATSKEEIAHVFDISLESAEKRIFEAIEKNSKSQEDKEKED